MKKIYKKENQSSDSSLQRSAMTTTPNRPKGVCCSWLNPGITVEPVVAALLLVISMTSSPMTDLVMRQACRQYNLDMDRCKADKDIDVEVHRTASSYTMYKLAIETLPGSIISLFCGPWSDTNGRKPMIITGLMGAAMSHAIMVYFSTVEQVHPNFMLLSGIPMALTGGIIIVILNCSCYIIDVTPPERRAIRIAVATAAQICAPAFGNIAVPFLEDISFAAVFSANTIILLVTVIYVVFFLEESVNIVEDKRTKLFTVGHLKDTYSIYIKKRPNNARGVIFAMTIQGFVSLLALTGESDVKYQTVIEKFEWKLADYSTYNVINIVAQFVCTFIGVYVGISLLHFKEVNLSLIVQGITCIATVAVAMSATPVFFYAVSLAMSFKCCLLPLTKTIISNCVPANEIGKILSFMSTVEAFTPQLGSMIYTSFYNATVGINPFLVYYLTAVFAIMGFFSLVAVAFLQRTPPKTKDIEETKTDTV